MTRREIVERSLVGVAARHLPRASRLRSALLALDVAAQPCGAVARATSQYRISPEKTGLWRARTIVPFHLARDRCSAPRTTSRCAGLFARCCLARLDDPTVSRLRSAASRCFATTRRRDSTRSSPSANDPRAALPGGGPPRRRRPRARSSSETRDRVALLSATVANLQLADRPRIRRTTRRSTTSSSRCSVAWYPAHRGRRRPEPVTRRKRFHGRGRRRSRQRLLRHGADVPDHPHAARSAARPRHRRLPLRRAPAGSVARARRA